MKKIINLGILFFLFASFYLQHSPIINDSEGYAKLGFNDLELPNNIVTEKESLDIEWPIYENFEIQYQPEDSLRLSSVTPSKIGGITMLKEEYSDNFSALDYSFDGLDSCKIPALRILTPNESTANIQFVFSNAPDNFDFIIWDIDRNDSCWVTAYDEANRIPITSFSIGDMSKQEPIPELPVWSNDSLLYSPENFAEHRSYFVAHFVNQAVSQISIRLKGDQFGCENLNEACPKYYFSLYAKHPPLLDSTPYVHQDILSPNEDGYNEKFVINGLQGFLDNELIIFNRWGDVLFQRKDYQNDWSGRNMSGQILPQGTYFYVLKLGDDTPVKKGHITILRD